MKNAERSERASIESVSVDSTDTQVRERRSTLGSMFLGGAALFLTACGKYVARFDKSLGSLSKSKGSEDERASPNESAVRGGSGGGGSGGGGSGGGGSGGDPTSTNFDPRPCFDLSKITDSRNQGDVLKLNGAALSGPALYGTERSALLAMKFKELAVSDHVHVFAPRPADEKQGVLLASRRIQLSDVGTDGCGVIFESLAFSGFKKLVVVVIRSGVTPSTYKFTIDVSSASAFRKSVPDGTEMRTVFDLSDASKAEENKKLFGLEFDKNAPSMMGTSFIASGVSLGTTKAQTTFTAAKSNSRWNVSSLVSPPMMTGQSVRVENIFGEEIKFDPTTNSMTQSDLFHLNQSVVVYVKKSKPIDGIGSVTGYQRYFFFIG